ncbi:ATP-grasp domain-containing protein [bacterium]|nr:ATP-grasp domain-containing protein [bacterium]
MKNITVLVTGSGAPGIAGTLYSLRNNPNKQPFKIVTTDIQPKPVGCYLSDSFFQLPSPESASYLGALRKVVEATQVRVILPQTTREINVLSQNFGEVESWGVKLVLSDWDAIKKANDKYLILKECEKNDVPCPDYRLVSSVGDLEDAIKSLGYPKKKVVVKPRISNGGRGVRIITNEDPSLDNYLAEKPNNMNSTLESFISIFKDEERFPDLIVSEYLPGLEYTIDMFRSNDCSVVIPRSRDSIRSGISFQTTVDMQREDLIRYSKRLADSIGLKYCFGFQFKLDKQGIPKVLESNPRVQGTMVASTMAGFNMIYYSVMSAMGIDQVGDEGVNDRSVFKRFWGGIGTNQNGHEIGRI